MIWIVAYRGDGAKTKQLTANGRAAAIVAAIALIERGIEVLSVTDDEKTRSVSEYEIQHISELSHTPSIQSLFRTSRRDERHDIPARIPGIHMMASAHQETAPRRRAQVATPANRRAS
jgi:hypothetical protein